MVTIKNIYEHLNGIMPFNTQLDFDNSGILIGKAGEINKVLICLDITAQVTNYAVANKYDLIISHHPIIFSPVKSISCDSVIYTLIENKIGAIACHTNYDKYVNGTSNVLAESLGICGTKTKEDFGVIITLDTEVTLKELSKIVRKAVNNPISISTECKAIKTIYVIAGSAGGEMQSILKIRPDCLITGEIKYHDALDLKEQGISTIAVGHDISEAMSLKILRDMIKLEYKAVSVEEYIVPPLMEII